MTLKGQEYLENTPVGQKCSTREFIKWLRAMADYHEDGLKVAPDEFRERKAITARCFDLPYTV